MITLSAFLCAELLAAAALALWVLVRFPTRGPQTIAGAGFSIVVAVIFSHVAPLAAPLVIKLPCGVYLVLIGIALPIFFGMFLSGGWFVRALVKRIGGSGGDGLRTPAMSTRLD